MSQLGGKSRRSMRKSSKRASKRASRRSSTKKGSRRGTKNPWIAFTSKHRASVVASLQRGNPKKYSNDKKGKMKLQQDALVEMGKMYRAQKH